MHSDEIDAIDRSNFNQRFISGRREQGLKDEIQALQSYKNSAMGRFDRLSIQSHEKDSKITRLEADVASCKHKLRRH